MRKSLRFALVLLALAQQLPAQNTSAGEQSKSLIDQASRAMRLFRQTDPSMKRFFFRSVGWAVYPVSPTPACSLVVPMEKAWSTNGA